MCHNVAWDTTVLIHQSFFYILMFFSQATQKVHSEMWYVCIALLCRHVIAFSPIVKFFGIWTCLFNCCICLFGTWVSCNAWVVLILKKWSWIMVWKWRTSRKVACLPANTLWLQELLAELTERATVITLFRDSATKIASDNQHDLFQEELLWTIFRL